MQREFEALLDMQRFDAGELDYAVLDRHVARLTQLSQVVNSGITVFDMYRRRHVFSSYNFPDLFRYDMDRFGGFRLFFRADSSRRPAGRPPQRYRLPAVHARA